MDADRETKQNTDVSEELTLITVVYNFKDIELTKLDLSRMFRTTGHPKVQNIVEVYIYPDHFGMSRHVLEEQYLA